MASKVAGLLSRRQWTVIVSNTANTAGQCTNIEPATEDEDLNALLRDYLPGGLVQRRIPSCRRRIQVYQGLVNYGQ